MPDQLAQASTAGLGFGLGVQRVIAQEILQLSIDEPIALQLTVDRGAMAAETLGDLQEAISRTGILASCQRAILRRSSRQRWTYERGMRILP